jgi:hypothetical protein
LQLLEIGLRSARIAGSAIVTTVPSIKAIAEARTVAAST